MQLFNISSPLGLLGTCLYGNSLCCCHPMYCQITKVHNTPHQHSFRKVSRLQRQSQGTESLSVIFISETYSHLMVNVLYSMNKNSPFICTPQQERHKEGVT